MVLTVMDEETIKDTKERISFAFQVISVLTVPGLTPSDITVFWYYSVSSLMALPVFSVLLSKMEGTMCCTGGSMERRE